MCILHDRMDFRYNKDRDDFFDMYYIAKDMSTNIWNISKKDMGIIKRCIHWYDKKILRKYCFPYDMPQLTKSEVIEIVSSGERLDSGFEPLTEFVVFNGFSERDGCKYASVLIDYTKSNDAIFESLRFVLEQARKCSVSLCADMSSMKMPYPEYFEAVALGGYGRGGDRVRAAGLWLWDRVQEIGNSPGASAQAIREFRNTDDIRTIGLENVEDTDLRFYLRRTSECIAKPGVLSFSKKGTRKSK